MGIAPWVKSFCERPSTGTFSCTIDVKKVKGYERSASQHMLVASLQDKTTAHSLQMLQATKRATLKEV
jgi:hypothetical protein